MVCLVLFLDRSTWSCLWSSSHIHVKMTVILWCSSLGNSGNPSLRQGKPGSGIGLGYGFRFKSQYGHFQVDYAINAFHQRTLYFGLSNFASWDPSTQELQSLASFPLLLCFLILIHRWWSPLADEYWSYWSYWSMCSV